MREDVAERRRYHREYYHRRCAEDPTYKTRYAASGLARRRRLGIKPAVRRTPGERKTRNAAGISRWWRERAGLMSFVRRALNNARLRARDKGLPFNITLDDIEVPEVCPVFGTPLSQGFRNRHTNFSLDRIIPAKGYVKGNVRVISWRANSLKSDATIDELKQVVAYMEREEKLASGVET